MNTGEELFANLVGSWDKRPEATTGLDNLFLAGTYVRHYADVATVEGGVASGLQAAEAVRLRHGVAGKIEVIEADEYPASFYKGLKVLWAPYCCLCESMVVGDPRVRPYSSVHRGIGSCLTIKVVATLARPRSNGLSFCQVGRKAAARLPGRSGITILTVKRSGAADARPEPK